MKTFLRYVLIVGVLAFAVQWAFIKYVPDLVYMIAVYRAGRPSDRWINAGKTDAGMRRVVMPNPDFIYSALFYDLDDSGLLISGVLPDSGYASLAFYDDRCQPYYVYNNLSPSHTGKFRIALSIHSAGGDRVVHAKTKKGVVICRYLVQGSQTFDKMSAYQSQLAAEKQ